VLAAQPERLGVHAVYGSPRLPGRVRRCPRIELEPFDFPAVKLCEMHEAAGVRADIEKAPGAALPPLPKRGED
jgi:hypothetical protein